MSGAVLLSAKIYLLAAAISMAVAAVIKLIGVVMAARAPSPAVAVPAPTASENVTTDVDVAAISAAVYAVMGSHRIVHIAQRSQGAAWASEGRTAHHGSHNLPRRGAQATPPKPKR